MALRNQPNSIICIYYYGFIGIYCYYYKYYYVFAVENYDLSIYFSICGDIFSSNLPLWFISIFCAYICTGLFFSSSFYLFFSGVYIIITGVRLLGSCTFSSYSSTGWWLCCSGVISTFSSSFYTLTGVFFSIMPSSKSSMLKWITSFYSSYSSSGLT